MLPLDTEAEATPFICIPLNAPHFQNIQIFRAFKQKFQNPPTGRPSPTFHYWKEQPLLVWHHVPDVMNVTTMPDAHDRQSHILL